MGLIDEGAKAAGEVAKVVKDNPHGAAAVDYFAQSAEIVTRTLRNLLLPFAAMNFGLEKAKHYFEEKFGGELREKLKEVDPEDVIEPKASLAGPAIQGIAYTLDEPELRDMYVTLLATGMSAADQDNAHPAFVRIIGELSGLEADMLRRIDDLGQSVHPMCSLIFTKEEPIGRQPFFVAVSNVLYWERVVEGTDIEPPDLLHGASMIDNWIRLGLFEAKNDVYAPGDDAYEWASTQPYKDRASEVLKLYQAESPQQFDLPDIEGDWQAGSLRPTAFGRSFFRAVLPSNHG